MNIAAQPLQSIRFRGRSFLAFALAPEPPVADWLSELDKWTRNSPGFFAGKPVILDLAAVTLERIGHPASGRPAGRARHPDHGARGRRPGRLRPQAAAGPDGRPPGRRGEAGRHPGRRCRRRLDRSCGSRARDRSGGTAAAAATGFAADREPDPFRAIGGVPVRRGHGAGLGRLGGRDRRRRLDPHLRHAARACHGGLHGRCQGADLLQPQRSRAAGHRRLLPDRREHGCATCAAGRCRSGSKGPD